MSWLCEHRLDPGQAMGKKLLLRFAARSLAIGIAAPGEIGARQIAGLHPALLVDERLQARAIGTGLRAKDAVAGTARRIRLRHALVDQRLRVRGDTRAASGF